MSYLHLPTRARHDSKAYILLRSLWSRWVRYHKTTFVGNTLINDVVLLPKIQ